MPITLSYPRPPAIEPTLPASAYQATLPAAGGIPGRRFELLQVGSRVLRYELEARVGRGGFGTVYRARDVERGDRVALKILHEELSISPSMVDRFRREAMSLNRIRHANIVQVRDVGALADGRPFFTMDWIDGRSLADVLERTGPLAPADTLPILSELAGALEAAHAADIVHRDLKASNVMVTQDRGLGVKLIDFGIAKLLDGLDGESSLTASGGCLGSPCSVSPEQILGGPIDRRADVYGLGTLIYHLITGAYPYDGATALAVEEKHLNAPVPRVSSRVPVSPAIDEVVARCMAKKRRDRFDSVSAAVDALRRAVDGRDAVELGVATLPAETRVARGLAIDVDLSIELCGIDEVDSELRKASRSVLAALRTQLDAAGLEVEELSSTGLLAVSLLGDDELSRRRELLVTALNLAYAPSGDGSTDARIQVRITAHVGDVMVAPGAAGYLCGELLDTGGWAEVATPGLVATDAALEQLDDDFVCASAGPGRWAIIASK